MMQNKYHLIVALIANIIILGTSTNDNQRGNEMDKHKSFRNCLAILKRDAKKIKKTKAFTHYSTNTIRDALKGIRKDYRIFQGEMK